MKLTKSERHTAYIIMLAECETNLSYYDSAGLCFMFNNVFGMSLYGGGQQFKATLPELYKKRTIKRRGFFFYWLGWHERIKYLKQCIEETYEEVPS